MRVKIFSKRTNKNIVMEVKVVEPYICNDKELYVDGFVFDIGSEEKIENMLESILKCGFLNLTSYNYWIDGININKNNEYIRF